MFSIQEEEENFLRAIRLMYCVAPKAVRHLFVKKHPDKAILTQKLMKEKTDLERISAFNKKNRHVLFPSSGNVDPNTFDLTLLIFLLRNFTKIPPPADGWNIVPAFADSSEAADLLRIRDVRNTVAHNRDGKFSQSDFEKLWKDMEIVLGRIGSGLFNAEVKDIKVAKIEESERENIEYLREKIEEMDRNIQDPVPHNIRLDMNDIVKNWTEDDKFFHETNFSKNVCHAIKANDFVMVTGNSGSGKTATIRHAALKLQSEGYEILPLKRIEDIRRYHSFDIKQIYVIDDIVGVHSLENQLAWELENIQDYLIRWKILQDKDFVEQGTTPESPKHSKNQENNTNKRNDSKILVSCRLHLTKMDSFPKLLLEVKNVNIQDESNNISYLERKAIFQKVFSKFRDDSESFKTDLSEDLIMGFDSFPLLCRMCAQSSSDPQTFFSLPFKYFLNEIENMYCSNSKLPYFVLIFCLVFYGRFPKESELAKREGFEQILDLCHLDRTTSHEKILETLNSMKGIYLNQTIDNEFDFYHIIIRDIVAYHFCSKRGFAILAKYASDSFIRDRVRPNGILPQDNTEDKLLITLDESDRKLYIQRICQDLFSKDWLLTLKKSIFPNSLIENEIYYHLQESQTLQKILSRGNEMRYRKRLTHIQAENKLMAELVEMPYKDINHLRDEILRPLQLIFWFIGFGWHQMFKNIYRISDSNIRSMIENSKHATLVLAALGNNEEMIYYIEKNIVKANKYCFICDSSAISENMFVHRCNCEIKYLSSFTIACINGNLRIANYLGEQFSFSADTKFNVSVLENICPPKVGPLQQHFLTALDLACTFGHVNLVREFLDEMESRESIAIDKIHNVFQRLLYIASFEGHNTIVNFLLQREEHVSINECDEQKMTALHAASGRGNAEVVETLLSKGADVNKCDIFGWTPLKVACAKGYVEVVKHLLNEESVLIESPGIDRPTSVEEMETIMEETSYSSLKRSFVNRRSETIVLVSPGYGFFPLLLASCNGHHEIVQLLLSKNASVDRKIDYENIKGTSLFAACSNGHARVVSELLEKGASLSLCDEHGTRTALMFACFRELNTFNVYITPSSVFKETDKFTFAEANRLDVVKILISKEPSPSFLNERNDEGMTAFVFASFSANFDIMKLLLKSGADINARNNKGETALWLASKNDQTRVVSFLVHHNADVNICNNNGESPLWIACLERNQMLITNLAFRLLHSTSWIPWTHTKIIYGLYVHGADINACNADGKSPLWVASSKGDQALLFWLLAKGASTNKCDNEGISPLRAAIRGFHFTTAVKLLWNKNSRETDG